MLEAFQLSSCRDTNILGTQKYYVPTLVLWERPQQEASSWLSSTRPSLREEDCLAWRFCYLIRSAVNLKSWRVTSVLERLWPMFCNAKRPFQRDPSFAEGSFIKQPSDQRYAVGDAAWRCERGQGMIGIGGPVAAGLPYFDESGAQGQGWVSGEVADDQHLVAQGRNQEQVDF